MHLSFASLNAWIVVAENTAPYSASEPYSHLQTEIGNQWHQVPALSPFIFTTQEPGRPGSWNPEIFRRLQNEGLIGANAELNPVQAAAALSHQRALNAFILSGKPWGIIMENGTSTAEIATWVEEQRVLDAPEDADILFLQVTSLSNEPSEGRAPYGEARAPYGEARAPYGEARAPYGPGYVWRTLGGRIPWGAYAISQAGAKKLLAAWKPLVSETDIQLGPLLAIHPDQAVGRSAYEPVRVEKEDVQRLHAYEMFQPFPAATGYGDARDVGSAQMSRPTNLCACLHRQEMFVSISVVVTCHGAYLHRLADALASVNEQARGQPQLKSRILVLDGCEQPLLQELQGWQVILGSWRDPNKARNAALPDLKTDWVTYLDADNIMPDGYIRSMLAQAATAPESVAFIYPHIVRVKEDLRTIWSHEALPYDYWQMREDGVVDTSSFWRTRVLQSVRWLEGISMLDDYAVMLGMTRLGWRGQKAVGTFVVLRSHGANRSLRQDTMGEDCFKMRELSVVTLCSGRRVIEKVLQWMGREKWPENVHFYFVDDSRSQAFHDWLLTLTCKLSPFARGVHVLKSSPDHSLHWTGWTRKHLRVADLYNQVLPGLRSEIILTVEDDVIPPVGAASALCAPLLPYHSSMAAVAGIYLSRDHEGFASVSSSIEEWRAVALGDIKQGIHPAGMVPGGCTAWAGWALQKVLPLSINLNPRPKLGWDGTACQRLAALGHQVFTHSDIYCEHLYHEQ